jgi:hypothetical protein
VYTQCTHIHVLMLYICTRVLTMCPHTCAHVGIHAQKHICTRAYALTTCAQGIYMCTCTPYTCTYMHAHVMYMRTKSCICDMYITCARAGNADALVVVFPCRYVCAKYCICVGLPMLRHMPVSSVFPLGTEVGGLVSIL